MRPHSVALLLAFLPCLTAVAPARAEAPGISPNVRTEYAQVLQVEPVYQTLRAQAVEQRCDHPAEATGMAPTNRNCRPVRVTREFQRPVAYDVDYILRGVKYRSRLPVDPGKRLRLRITITPDIPPGERR
ncbi:MAG: hypothetical protein ACTHOH_04900 [Lysobacteraceae bacterium]